MKGVGREREVEGNSEERERKQGKHGRGTNKQQNKTSKSAMTSLKLRIQRLLGTWCLTHGFPNTHAKFGINWTKNARNILNLLYA